MTTPVSKAIRHLRSGTLLTTSASWLRSRSDFFQWKLCGYSVVRVNPQAAMKVYRDSRLSQLIRDGDFERIERTFVERFLRPGDVFVDVGANVGLYSVLAAALVHSQGRVIAFEPCRRSYLRLLENVRRNRFRNVICVEAALSDTEGTARLASAVGEMDAWNTLGTPSVVDEFQWEEIVTTTWNRYCVANNLGGPIHLMKIDVEGWEEHVLMGASETLSARDAPVLQVEFCEDNARRASSSCARVYDVLRHFGYYLFSYNREENCLLPVGREAATGNRNLFAIKAIETVRERLISCAG